MNVSSGVEEAPGVKNVPKASRFIATVIDDVPVLKSDFWDIGF